MGDVKERQEMDSKLTKLLQRIYGHVEPQIQTNILISVSFQKKL